MIDQKNQDIIEGIKKGDKKIISEFYENNLPKVTSHILSNSGDENDARDVFQDAFVIMYQKIKSPDFKIDCAVGTYIYAISKNVWLNRLRKQGRMITGKEESQLDSVLTENAIDQLERQERIAIIQKHCLKLGEGCRRILLLFFSGYSLKEIADIKGFTLGYTRKRKFDCQKKLTEMVESDPAFMELKESSKSQ